LVKNTEGIPYFRDAAESSTIISRLVPKVSCNVLLLLQEARKIEKAISKMKRRNTENERNPYD
jgi:hypothetical protein